MLKRGDWSLTYSSPLRGRRRRSWCSSSRESQLSNPKVMTIKHETHMLNPIRRILQRRLHILNPRRRNQPIEPRVLRRNLRNHAVHLLGILHIDVSVAEGTFEAVTRPCVS